MKIKLELKLKPKLKLKLELKLRSKKFVCLFGPDGGMELFQVVAELRVRNTRPSGVFRALNSLFLAIYYKCICDLIVSHLCET